LKTLISTVLLGSFDSVPPQELGTEAHPQ
jgi:hypothetical protein